MKTFLIIVILGFHLNKARYQRHHYYVDSGRSTLARSLVNDSSLPEITVENVHDWALNNCERYNILFDAKLRFFTLSLVERLMHYKYNPKYEGKQKSNPFIALK